MNYRIVDFDSDFIFVVHSPSLSLDSTASKVKIKTVQVRFPVFGCSVLRLYGEYKNSSF